MLKLIADGALDDMASRDKENEDEGCTEKQWRFQITYLKSQYSRHTNYANRFVAFHIHRRNQDTVPWNSSSEFS